MRRLAILLAGAALLAGCAAPAVPEAASAVQSVSSEAGTGHFYMIRCNQNSHCMTV